MCTVLLPPGVNSIAVNKYIISCTEGREVAYLSNTMWDRRTETRSDDVHVELLDMSFIFPLFITVPF